MAEVDLILNIKTKNFITILIISILWRKLIKYHLGGVRLPMLHCKGPSLLKLRLSGVQSHLIYAYTVSWLVNI